MSKNTLNKDENVVWEELGVDDDILQNLLDNPLHDLSTSRLRDGIQHEGFDNNVGESWIYPNNLPCRSYQMSIVQSALYRNTLVVLPTGLGKTFIAAVVMYNFYRWYPRGKIIFMAPTRPLVNQQIDACQKVMPFPKKDTIELTGKLQRSKRSEMWKNKRVFFATPQVVQSDIIGTAQQEALSVDETSFEETGRTNSTDFPFDNVKLVVIDEAHKAKGKYAYTEVVQALSRKTKYFRVLALSATPGRTMEDVAEVCRNLLISHIEVRWETSFDVLPFVHKRTMDTVVVSLGEEIKEIREKLLVIVDPYLRQLTEAEVLSGSLSNINRNFLLFEQKRFRDRSYHMGRHPQHSAVVSNFAICISIYHAMELLERHGLRVFFNNFEEDEDGKNKFVLKMDSRLNNLVEQLKKQMGPNPFEFSAAPMTNGKIAEIPKDLDFGHPKFEKTRECLIKHFENHKDSRAIVFCEYRESVMLIYRMLLQHVPLLKPRCFVGQGGGGSLRALTQKQQIQIMNDFRSGKSNILIATSVGEEGIDVGEVELIVCFDISTSNPMRFVQRIGRTGRKKSGHVIMMVTEGREQQMLREVLSSKDQINKKLLKSSVVQQSLYQHAPRLVPTEFKPKCIQTFVKPLSDDEEVVSNKRKKVLKKKAMTPTKSSQDLRKFFQKKPQQLDKEDLEFFENDTCTTQACKPGVQTQQNIVNNLDKMKNLFKDLQPPIATQTQKSTKNSQSKLEKSQGSIKNFLKDASTSNNNNNKDHNLNKILNDSKKPVNDFANVTIDLCDKYDDSDEIHTDILKNNSLIQKTDNNERLKKFKEFIKTPITTTEVLKRAEISDLNHHLKSNELSRQMKYLLLRMRPEHIKKNLEQMQILSVLYKNEDTNYSEEEKCIREINSIILDLFGGLEKVEKFVEDLELAKHKQICLESESESEEEDPQEMPNFQKKLDIILAGYGDDRKHDNYNWIQQRFKATSFYKDKIKTETHNKVQESIVYDTFDEAEYENSSHNFDDFSISDSKYCSQWHEFNKPDIAFKSTPLQPSIYKPLQRDCTLTKKTSLLSKLEETEEEHDLDENKNDTSSTSTNSKQIQNMLVVLENKLKESSLNAAKSSASPEDELEELENDVKAKRKDYEMRMAAAESMISKTNYFEDFDLPDDDDLIKAAEEAELKCTQNKTSSTPLKNVCPEVANSKDPSLNCTPELDLSSGHVRKSSTLATPAELYLQQELDIDMEAFMDPFPEELELLEHNQFSFSNDRLKENLSTATLSAVRESPDLFAEDHLRSPIKKPIATKKNSFSSKLSAKLNMQNCQSLSLASPISPQKPLCSTQNVKELLTSPSSRLATNKQKYEKSPSLFDMYLQTTKGKGKLPKSLTKSCSMLIACEKLTNHISKPLKESTSDMPLSQQNESLIVIRNRNGLASKRKIFDSDSEQEEGDKQQLNGLSAIKSKADKDDDSDFEEVPATQKHNESSIIHQRRKRRRFNCFIEEEARVSGSDQSGDETEHTINRYAYDTIVVASDDEDPDQASTSNMQAIYLRSLKSPQQRRGRFKIPAPRVFNDRSRIFSQPVLPESTYSQYLPDSFVVAEEDISLINHNAETTMCPLERAEKILEERRKAKKSALLEEHRNKKKSKLKILTIEDSSEDDDFE